MKIYAKKALLKDGWKENQVIAVKDGIIADIEEGTAGDVSCNLLTPGLFDIHAHGGEGYDTAQLDRESLKKYRMGLARHGVTDLLLTTSSFSEYEAPLSFMSEEMHKPEGAFVQGFHLEGPFLNPNKSGAMTKENMKKPDVAAYKEMFDAFKKDVKLVTVAAERDENGDLIRFLTDQHIRVQIGHTTADYEEGERAFSQGVTSLCHTFNACPSIHHRNPGCVTAALLNPDVYCEAICDLKHLFAPIVKMVYRLKGEKRMMIISDSGAPTGLPDGFYTFGGKNYQVLDGTLRVNGGETLSGGACYIDKSVKNLVGIGIPSEEAFRMASFTPAEYLGISDRIGTIEKGKDAHLAAWEEEGKCLFSVIGEQLVNNPCS